MAAKKKKKVTRRSKLWTRLNNENLLDYRICDLGINLRNSPVKKRIDQLYRELVRRKIKFKPHFWLSDEWYCPDGIPGVAIPFFLAHPRLKRLEFDFMLEVEGGEHKWCMKLLRHETAHALLNAYKLDQRKDWRKIFGRPNASYPEIYLPSPYSKRYVLNLPNWYAQAHPHEDWAETFAVWLNPKSAWRKRYRSWPALKKLEYVDELMTEIKCLKPKLRNKRQLTPVEKIRTTLREYYDDKVARYGMDSPEFFDRDLRKLFSAANEKPRGEKASKYIRRVQQEILEIVERWTDEYRYRINEVLKDMIKRCDKLDLRVNKIDKALMPEMTACLTMLVMNKLHSGGFHFAL